MPHSHFSSNILSGQWSGLGKPPRILTMHPDIIENLLLIEISFFFLLVERKQAFFFGLLVLEGASQVSHPVQTSDNLQIH